MDFVILFVRLTKLQGSLVQSRLWIEILVAGMGRWWPGSAIQSRATPFRLFWPIRDSDKRASLNILLGLGMDRTGGGGERVIANLLRSVSHVSNRNYCTVTFPYRWQIASIWLVRTIMRSAGYLTVDNQVSMDGDGIMG